MVLNRGFNGLSTDFRGKMLISSESTNTLAEKISVSDEVFCNGLFLSARWFVISQFDYDGIQLVILPEKESAEYCAADLYNLIEGDRIFFLPDSGKTLERSNYKSSLGVQRTSAVGKILEYEEGKLVAYLRENSVKGYPILKVLSADGGETWSEIYNTSMDSGHRPVSGLLADGRVMVTYRYIFLNDLCIRGFGLPDYRSTVK